MERARRLAKLGYVAMAADMFGDRRQARDLEDMRGLVGGLRNDPAKLRARARGRRWVPWALTAASTAVAAAAVMVLWLRAPVTKIVREPTAAAKLPASWTSRPTDPLIGPIAREQAGDASSRIDYIFADRLDGFRERRLSARGGKP